MNTWRLIPLDAAQTVKFQSKGFHDPDSFDCTSWMSHKSLQEKTGSSLVSTSRKRSWWDLIG